MERVQSLVIGAGVVGLACARVLARSGREVVVAEAGPAIGTGTSSRNSEVVHAGIYYPAGSMKARHCVRGAAQLIRFCQEREVRYRVCGKLIVATSQAQQAKLASIAAHAEQNGVLLHPLTSSDVRAMEPEVSCVAALHSPKTAIVDSHGFMEALLAEAEEEGALLALHTGIGPGGRLLSSGGATVVAVTTGGASAEAFQIEAQEVVNCAGLAAPRVASHLGVPGADVPQPHFCKGNYYALQGCASPFSRLVYPVPEENTSGLGVHATVDLAGSVRFGPDVEWLPSQLPGGLPVEDAAYGREGAAVAYTVDTARAEAFYGEVRRYWPGLPDDSLVADYSGIRPKLSGPGMPAADFRLVAHGAPPGVRPSVVSLFGIESPGLTSALSLAEEVLRLLGPPP